MRQILTAILLLASCSIGMQAQVLGPETRIQKVKVIDEVRYLLLRNAEFNVYDSKGKPIVFESYENTGTVNGKEVFGGHQFNISGFVDSLTIEAKVEGYTFIDTTLVLSKEKFKRYGDLYVWDEEILLKTTLEPYKELEEVAVNATRILMVQKGDTIIYNAAALQLSAGSMLNDLVRALPGAQLDKGGKITINGERVTSLLVNGKDFFKGDPMVALTNLPYYTVDKIKVYHKGPELKNATQSDSLRAEAAEKPLVMDVRLKKEYGQGWLANAEAGAGVRTLGKFSPIYRGRAFALRFTDHSRLGMYGTANNVGDNYKPTHNGQWREMKAESAGEPVIQRGGIDFSIENKPSTMKLSTTLDAQHSTNDVESITSAQDFFNTGDIFRRSRSYNHSNSTSLSWNATLSRDIDRKYSISLSPRFRFNAGNGNFNSQNATFDSDPQDLGLGSSLDSIFAEPYSQNLYRKVITSQQRLGAEQSWGVSTGLSANGSIRLPFTGENLSVSAYVNYHERNNTSISFSQIAGRNVSTYNDDTQKTSPSSSLSYLAGIRHKLFDINSQSAGFFYSSLACTYSHNSSDDDYKLRRSNERLPEYITDMETGQQWPIDGANSYWKDESSDKHSINLEFNYNTPRNKRGKSYYLRFSMPVDYQRRELNDIRDLGNQHLLDKDWTFNPSVNISDGGFFNLSYNMRTNLPMLEDMLDITDNSYPLFVSKGNPDLHTAYTHSLNFSITTKRPKISQWLNCNLAAEILKDEIKYSTTYDRTTGIYTWQPRNIDGNWWTMAHISFGRALDKDKRWNLSLDSKYVFAHSTDFNSDAMELEPQKSLVLNHRINQNFKVSYGKKDFRVELNGWVGWSYATSDRKNFQRLNYIDQSYGFTLMTPLIWGIDLDTDLLLYLRRGYQDASMNTTELQWNAALSTRFGKKKLWTARLVGFDLLHQLSNITRTLNSQGRVETWHNTVRSYVNLNLTYHFEMKPKKGINHAE